MKTILVIILVLAIVAGAIWASTKYFGLFADADKDGIPDEVEDAVEDVKATAKEVKRRAKRVKEELGDIGGAVKDVAEQVGDVAQAVKGKPRKGRKPKAKK
jgi:hypothetical protein